MNQKETVAEEDLEEVGGSGRRKKMRTTFTGKQVSAFTFSFITLYTIYNLYITPLTHLHLRVKSFIFSITLYTIDKFDFLRNISKQIYELEKMFETRKYLNAAERSQLSRQVKDKDGVC